MKEKKLKKVLILGVNGFIGSHLVRKLLSQEDYFISGLDLYQDNLDELIKHEHFDFLQGDLIENQKWVEQKIKDSDIVLPLIAIATPKDYIRNPLKVFELDFEENLKIIKLCVKYNKRVIFPSTSEVYGMCPDKYFDEDQSELVVGPINKQRWIYSSSKQLLDRVIWAYGEQKKLQFTLFRPFNWIGARLDSLASARAGSARVITKMIANLVDGQAIEVVDGGLQKRCFTDIADGTSALFAIIENKNNNCNGQIINIGNPENEFSIQELATRVITLYKQSKWYDSFPKVLKPVFVGSTRYYGKGYQDVNFRKPKVEKAKYLLNWRASISLDESLADIIEYFLAKEFRNNNSISVAG